jgi:hypothetical protein
MNNRYREPHPVEIECGIYVIENYYGRQIFDEVFITWEEAQNFIDTFNWEKLKESKENNA